MNARNKSLNRVLDVIETVCDIAGKAASFTIILILIIALVLIVSRRLTPYTGFTLWTSEDEEMPIFSILISAYFTLGAAYAFHSHSFVSFEFIRSRFPARARAAMELVTYPLVFVAFSVLAWSLTNDLITAFPKGFGTVESFGLITPLMSLEAYLRVISLVAWSLGTFLLLLEISSRYIRAIAVFIGEGKPDGR